MMNKASPRRRAPKLPVEERRRQILDAAVTVFARLGYAAAGTADIARAAGIGEPTIYRYFANKREVYLAATRRATDDILDAWRGIADGAPDPLTALQRIGIWYFQRIQSQPELLALRARAIADSHDEEIAAVARDGYREVLHFVESLFAQAQCDGLIAPDEDVQNYTWLFMAVGALLDQARTLGLDDLKPEQVLKMTALIHPIATGRSAS
jgi:AcrR family transcriptional regulator